MSDRERRFERLERPRQSGPDGDERPPASDRFGSVEPFADASDRSAAAPAVQASTADRFREPPPRPLDVAVAAEEEQPFTRCLHCEADSSRYAARCSTCGRPLDTADQRAFNERLWAERRAERAEEERLVTERRAAADQESSASGRLHRQAAEELAREVGRRERARLNRRLGGDGVLSLLLDLFTVGRRRRW